jgi:hypothetical protein
MDSAIGGVIFERPCPSGNGQISEIYEFADPTRPQTGSRNKNRAVFDKNREAIRCLLGDPMG